MKSAEQILEEKIKIRQGQLTGILWTSTALDAMEEYANQFRKPAVSGRSELLLAFWDWYCKEDNVDNKYTADEMINAFLASNSH